jgi:hypothetical protein
VLVAAVLALVLQHEPCRGDAARHVEEALRRGAAFDLSGAADEYDAAARAGCAAGGPVAVYVRGLLAARAADAQFGSAASLQPLQQAIGVLELAAASDPVSRIMHAVLRAARPAAQHERAEMALFIDEMLRLESVQLAAGFQALPVISAHEAAGFFWLQLHAYNEAERAFGVAAQLLGPTPHVLLGLARTAAGRPDRPAACERYGQLVAIWESRPVSPPEIVEARVYLKQPHCTRPAGTRQ